MLPSQIKARESVSQFTLDYIPSATGPGLNRRAAGIGIIETDGDEFAIIYG